MNPNFYAGFVPKEKTDLEEGKLYWWLLTDGSWGAVTLQDGRLYWIGDEAGVPLDEIGGVFVGPVPEPTAYFLTFTSAPGRKS